MVEERRYTDDEVEQIFRSAASPAIRGRDLPARSGLTLADLQAIGQEVGISPEGIAEAAARVGRRPAPVPGRTLFGMPISVGRTVDLPRAPTDREWSVLLGELREVFQAHGRESTSLDARSWRNGNLHVVVEPTERGYRLRLATRKGDATATVALGLFAALVTVVLLLSGGTEEVIRATLFALASIGALSYNAVRLPRWASERTEQMEYIASRAIELTSAGVELPTER
jgi:hypothetical protein